MSKRSSVVHAMQEADHEQVENLLHSICHEFMASHGTMYGGYWEDCRSEINELYVDAHQSYREGYGKKYSSWIRDKVWYGLLDSVRSRLAKMRRRPPHVDLEVVEVAYETPSFRLDEFMEGLSEDARLLVQMVFNPPFDLLLAVKGKTDPNFIKFGLKEVVRDMGWTTRQVTQSFKEIREALG